MDSMSGEIALVTGSTSGLGRAAAIGLAQRGWKVIVVGRDQARGGSADYLLADLSSMAQVRTLAEACSQPGDVGCGFLHELSGTRSTQARSTRPASRVRAGGG